jgi:hypothetical protein
MIREQLGSGPPKCMAAHPFLSAEFGRCYRNGKRAVLNIGGSVPYDWQSGNENRLYLTGKLNAVGPEGLQVDVTPKPGGKKLILFLRARIRSRLQLFGAAQQPQTAGLELKLATVAKTVNGLSER